MRKFLQPVLAAAFGLAVGLGVTWIAGENPWHVLQILGKSLIRQFGHVVRIGKW